MMRYYLVSEDWLISPTARRVYRFCAWISFLLLPTFALLVKFPEGSALPHVVILAVHLLLLLSVIANAVICVAMQHFLFVEDESDAWKQILWFLALAVLGVGPGLFVLLAYSKSPLFEKTTAQSATVERI